MSDEKIILTPGKPVRINDKITGIFLSYIQTENKDPMCRILVDPIDSVKELHFLSRAKKETLGHRVSEIPYQVKEILENANVLLVLRCYEFELKPLDHE